MDALFQSTFLCSLLMFWLCIYHGLRQNERKFLTFYLPKLIVILPMWLCAIVLATWEKYNELRDPTYNHFVDTGNYQVWINHQLICLSSFFRENVKNLFQLCCFLGFPNIFLHILCNVSTLLGIAHTESLQWTSIDAIFWWDSLLLFHSTQLDCSDFNTNAFYFCV